MPEFSVASALSLPSVSISPSVKGLQFSDDGQAFLLTKHAVYILTPDAGVNVELSSVIKQALDSNLRTRSAKPLGWLRTILEFDRCLEHQWPTECQDWGSVCLGSLDPSLQALALSPSNLTSNAGCLVALLNSNLELTIWGASKNFLTGEWIRLQDVTTLLKEAAANEPSTPLLRALRAQTTCIEWTPQPDWGLTPAPAVDASLLAVGNRAGSVTFLRYDSAHDQMVVVDSAVVADRWVTHLSYSAWTDCQDGVCGAMLASAAADGSVTVLNIRQKLTAKPSLANLLPEYDFGLSTHPGGEPVCPADGRAVTGMRWITVRGRNPVLIFHKAGTLHLWQPSAPLSAWSGCKVLVLRTQKRSVGSSALCPASGICYVPSRDLAIVSLSDGSFHVVHRLSVDPTLDPPPSEAVSSDALSAASRAVFVHTEPEKVSLKDVDRISGMTSYDDSSTFMWTYEASRPTDFSYKHDAKHVSSLVVAQLWEEDADERLIQNLAECIGRSKTATGQAPIYRLRPILVHLRDPQRIVRLCERILDTLRNAPFREPVPSFAMPIYAGAQGPELPRDLARSLTTHLFGWDGVLSERLRYSVAAFCQNYSTAPDVQQQFADAVQEFVSNIRTHFLLALLRHLSAVMEALNSSDVHFARRTILLATMPGVPPALTKAADELSSRLAQTANTEAREDTQESLDESCPACHASIPLQDAESAVCLNGHAWARCCVTSFLLATPMVRTCVGCSRKAFLPASSQGTPTNDPGWLPNSARGSWVLRDLLNATRRCPFCGNNFFTLV
ncbi:hypothetical protein GY45DRAFT_1369805 [Cubamyces sp. BRFM 1775]|nr:hypothetical protein GY45DRAFT_1369805 [Cubamyces sp. BRFM 1775]